MSEIESGSSFPGGGRGRITPEYRQIEPYLDTGDVVLFGGTSDLCRRIKWLTRSKWSHAAMLLRHEPSGPVFLWEATAASDLPDFETGRKSSGIRVIPFEEWICAYGEDIAVRRLLVERTPQMRAALEEFRHKVHDAPYETQEFQLLRASYDGPFGRNSYEDLSSIFCSELVAAAYQRMGLLPYEPPSNEYTPRDFSTQRRPRLRLLQGAKLQLEWLVST